MTIQLPEDVRTIIHTLEEAGYEAYAVGGCVRDSLMGRIPNDWDITTSAKPQETKALFGRTIDTGIRHGTVTVMLHRNGYEVTTYRVDGEYEDGRHPKEVTFTASLTEDLKRRDFTINAMAYNDKDGLVDAFCGKEDLERGVIRCVGDADERFTEDALRILRAVRFSAQLGFEIEEKTKEAIRGHAGRLSQVSAERIQVELNKLVTSPHPEYLRYAWETGITAQILPEFDWLMELPLSRHLGCNAGEHTLRAMAAVGPDKVLRLTMLFHDFGEMQRAPRDGEKAGPPHAHAAVSAGMAREVMKRLRYDNATMERVAALVYWHETEILPEKRAVRRAISEIGRELFPQLLTVKQADLDAQSGPCGQEEQELLDRISGIGGEILKAGDCLTVKELAVNGRDLMEAGIRPDPQIGHALQELLELVLERPERNTKEYLLANLPKGT